VLVRFDGNFLTPFEVPIIIVASDTGE
jgi:hypothetical protein